MLMAFLGFPVPGVALQPHAAAETVLRLADAPDREKHAGRFAQLVQPLSSSG
jgi:hypothetical protein